MQIKTQSKHLFFGAIVVSIKHDWINDLDINKIPAARYWFEKRLSLITASFNVRLFRNFQAMMKESNVQANVQANVN
jgi:hypothetical protein